MAHEKAEDLFPELKALGLAKKKSRPIPRARTIEPDALVMCRLKFVCKCGTKHEAPNRTILLRYGHDLRKIKTWFDKYNFIHREVVTRTEHVIACDYCFLDGFWSFTDHKAEHGNVKEEVREGQD